MKLIEYRRIMNKKDQVCVALRNLNDKERHLKYFYISRQNLLVTSRLQYVVVLIARNKNVHSCTLGCANKDLRLFQQSSGDFRRQPRNLPIGWANSQAILEVSSYTSKVSRTLLKMPQILICTAYCTSRHVIQYYTQEYMLVEQLFTYQLCCIHIV